MAQVQFGSLVTDIKGKIGGHCFKGNYSAASIQNINKPRTTQTNFNQSGKSLMAYVSSIWRTLSVAERADWNTLALTWPFINCFGETWYGSGYMVFCHTNLNRLSVGVAISNTAVAREIDLPITNFAAQWTNDIDTCTFTFDNVDILANWVLSVKCSKPLSRGIYHRPKDLFQVRYTANGLGLVNVKYGSYYNTRYSLIMQGMTGSRLYIQIKAISSISGQAAPVAGIFVNSPD